MSAAQPGAAVERATGSILEAGIDPRDVVAFPQGLPGFERCRGFVLMTSEQAAPLCTLVSVEGPAASFVAIDPGVVLPGYRYQLAPADLQRLEAEPDAPLVWLALVMIEPDGGIAVNLRAPIVINSARMIGCQVMPHDCLYPLRYPLAPGE